MRFSFLFILLLLCRLTSSQSKESARELFDDGEYFFHRGEYGEAAYYFKKLIEKDPDNSHFNFKLGECYMNIPGKEELAIPFFEKATQSIVEKKKYKIRDFEENSAPLHAWFYLGNVYRMSGRLNEALNSYNTFVNSPFYYGNYNINIVENEISSCERAKIIMDSPIDVIIESVDSMVNSPDSEISPVITSDQKTLFFVRKLKFYDAILQVTKEGNSWSPPLNLNPLIGSDGDFYPVFISDDGDELYLVKNNPGNKDLYVSYKRNNTWTKAESLGKNINSLSDETSACLSADEKKLWFTSSRKGGFGGTDIYYSERDKNNQWGKPKNAGKIINTQFDEESPYLCKNDSLLFFSSKGHYSMGGFDIFYTSVIQKGWKEPQNIGYPVNNTLNNIGFIPVDNGRTGYFSAIDLNESSNLEDIFRIFFRSYYPLP